MSTTKRSKKFNIKPSSPLGTIISPPDNCEYRAWNPISLIGNCYDVLGDKLDWKKHEIVWRINGELQKNNIPKTVLKELPPGKYSIEIASNKWGVLSAHSIQIKSPTDDQDRHRQLFDKYDTIEMK